MGHPKPKQILTSSKVAVLGILESIAALAFLCARCTRRASRKLARATFKSSINKRVLGGHNDHKGRKGELYEFGEESFGEGVLWRKSILMGDKCEPLDFSGVIYYDSYGNKLSEAPMKSPRASPLLGYGHQTCLDSKS